MNKYNKLWEHIKTCNEKEMILSFEEIKDICGVEIDHSFLIYKKELTQYGYKVTKISLKEKTIKFQKI